jgi:hypothetical protein
MPRTGLPTACRQQRSALLGNNTPANQTSLPLGRQNSAQGGSPLAWRLDEGSAVIPRDAGTRPQIQIRINRALIAMAGRSDPFLRESAISFFLKTDIIRSRHNATIG